MRKLHTCWIVAAASLFAVPALADCGACGSGCTGAKHTAGVKQKATLASIGEAAPDFTLTDVNGKTHSLSDYKGKVVVLEWLNHECPVTNRYTKTNVMRNTLAKFKGKPVAWLAIDSSHFADEKIQDIRKWVEANSLAYPLLLDAPGKVGHTYDAKTTPHIFVIDQKGTLAYQGAVDDDPYGNKDNPRNYVEEAITALLNGSTVSTTTTKPVGCSVKYKT